MFVSLYLSWAFKIVTRLLPDDKVQVYILKDKIRTAGPQLLRESKPKCSCIYHVLSLGY